MFLRKIIVVNGFAKLTTHMGMNCCSLKMPNPAFERDRPEAACPSI
jgi:hypothetical protein